MKRISSNYKTLQLLKDASPKLRKAILLNCKKEVIYSIIECALNVLNGNCRLSPCAVKRLHKYRHHLRRLVDPAINVNAKRKALVQSGGFLLPLLSAVLPSLIALFRKQK